MSQQIFVFGSNLAGRHGKGAAKFAHENHGAEYGVGKGLTGSAYALPTKDEKIRTLPLERIEKEILEFFQFARKNENLTFILTPVGCGLAGYSSYIMMKLFKKYWGNDIKNVFLAKTWLDHF